jgi:hypothetical protein
MNRRSKLSVAVILVLTAFYFASEYFISQNQRMGGVTAFSQGAAGTGIFYSYLEKSDRAPELRQSALLTEQDLKGKGGLAVFSPSSPLSAHEANLIAKFVAEGGKLLVSAHHEASLAALSRLLSEVHASVSFKKRSNFKNGEVTAASPSETFSLFGAHESYSFYSAFQITGCLDPFDCFVKRTRYKKGEIIFIAGLPLVSNALIHLSDNRKFGFRVARWAAPLLIDEYHHFFSDKTLWDLVKEPAFGLTLAGVLVAVLLFFVFGHTEFHESSLLPAVRASGLTYHQVNEGIVLEKLRTPEAFRAALQQQEIFLLRCFPERRRDLISQLETERLRRPQTLSLKQFLNSAQALLKIHSTWLIKRRFK